MPRENVCSASPLNSMARRSWAAAERVNAVRLAIIAGQFYDD